jgi:hypothetical protein
MNSERPSLKILFQKYLDGKATSLELEDFFSQIDLLDEATTKEDLLLSHFSKEETDIPEWLVDRSAPIVDAAWVNINRYQTSNLQDSEASKFRIYAYIAAACLILCLLFLGLYQQNKINFNKDSKYAHNESLLPNTNGAKLLLENGQIFELNSKDSGIVINQHGIAYENGSMITKSNKNELVTLSTPAAGKYKVTLPDGSKVWLNADSKLIYPTKFTDSERQVELRGEAYFEIKKLYSKNNLKSNQMRVPFIVKGPDLDIEVLGTKFNVRAYETDLEKKATLLEGKIKLKSFNKGRNEDKILNPGEQAIIRAGNLAVTSAIDVRQQTAWKDGIILLDQQTIDQVLKQIERSYDVVFVFEYKINLPTKTLSGELQPNLSLLSLLKALEKQSGLTFEIKGRRIMVHK